MSHENGLLKVFKTTGLVLALGMSMTACSATKSWKEEVLLHDGNKIIVNRSVELGGRHEIRQKPPYREQSLTFTLPNTSERITWEDHFSEALGSSNFNPMLLEVFGNTAYVLSSPAGCFSYNTWGRPNPPYVVFKYQDKVWKRIPLQELPAEIKVPNLVVSSPDDVARNVKYGVITAEMIRHENEALDQPEDRTILRTPETTGMVGCPNLERYKGGWRTPGGPKLAYPITPPDANSKNKP